ncbi:DUF5682 family protein [Neolewinella lacunae]|uniref:Uncharacterized protein n=1 Tax=Neolewinella lacunae TaxID=1517758 RepID=A0A923PNV9_9BACT|nr:DUF5682 family protein [Neolewinella lacunae]MBC6995870.1 hypothetical protein [Neolewinella lacunae]MDN3636437.1 DUF5682 family protein [Neolewinella lacunae]
MPLGRYTPSTLYRNWESGRCPVLLPTPGDETKTIAPNDRMETRTYGIRHHGPGSARRLVAALAAYEPDLILIEMPADVGAGLLEVVASGMRPPVALVLYDAKDIERASFYPFASFSPEYQAIAWAAGRGVEVRPIDLPAQHYLAQTAAHVPPTLFADPTPPPEEASPIPGKSAKALRRQLRQDPLSLLAELGGYADGESWWDATLERGDTDAEATFAALREIITELRTAFPAASDAENERREAWMRNEIRQALKSGAERVAIVVGAFHLSAVTEVHRFPAATDKARVKGLPKVKIARAWVPWSYPRLAKAGGYAAGVISPAWYGLLYEYPTAATARWMATAAGLLREAGYDASPALASEGVALAEVLANLRGHERPGGNELEEALLGTLAAGTPERLALIHEKLTVGTTVGFVPPGVTTVPLAEDLHRELKSTRLAKLWETAGQQYLKATKTAPRGGIDLRTDNDLRKSHLLHRLNLLDIHWGTLQPAGPDALSSFREVWLLEWQPEFSLYLIERASYGNTLPLAAGRYAVEKALGLPTVLPLAQLTLDCLRANLPEVVPDLLAALRARAAETNDVASLLAALPALVQTSRYGDTRKTDTSGLVQIIDELLPRLAAGLPAAATNIDDEQASEMLRQLAAANYALAQLENETYDEIWIGGLQRLATTSGANPLLTGHGVRLLYEHGQLDYAAAAQRFSRALSAANGAHDVAQWLTGFLYGSGQLLFHYPPLWGLVDEWVRGLAWEDFELVLPLLRRTFADFSSFDRRRLLGLAVAEQGKTQVEEEREPGPPSAPPTAEHPAEDLVEALLGWLGGGQ